MKVKLSGIIMLVFLFIAVSAFGEQMIGPNPASSGPSFRTCQYTEFLFITLSTYRL